MRLEDEVLYSFPWEIKIVKTTFVGDRFEQLLDYRAKRDARKGKGKGKGEDDEGKGRKGGGKGKNGKAKWAAHLTLGVTSASD